MKHLVENILYIMIGIFVDEFDPDQIFAKWRAKYKLSESYTFFIDDKLSSEVLF